MLYNEALCNKMLGKNHLCTTPYLAHMSGMGIQNRFQLNVSMFGVLVLPSLDNRRQILSHLENLLDAMLFFSNHRDHKPMTERYFSKENDHWHE